MKPVRLAIAGAGAFGTRHAQAIARIDEAVLVTVVDPDAGKASRLAGRFGAAASTTDLDAVWTDPLIDAVILCTPTPLHAAQAIAGLHAGKHVEVEIPMADSWRDAEAVIAAQRASGKVAMCGHTRRFNPSHQWVHREIVADRLRIQHLDVQTFFMRRSNVNLQGEPRSWTDHLLWHHAAHTVDLFAWQTGEPIVRAQALHGPPHPVLGIAMDLSIQLRSAGGALCTIALSFNNDGPQGSFFRYIGDRGTYVARYDDLFDGSEQPVDVSGVDVSTDGIELQDREFVAAIREGRAPRSSVQDVAACYRVLQDLADGLADDAAGA